MIFSTKQKEHKIIGTLLYCNNEMEKFNHNNVKQNKVINNLMEKNNIYHYNFIQLFENDFSSDDETIKSLLESNSILNTNKNYYCYFNKVYKFIDGYEPLLMNTLNESLIIPDNDNNIDLLAFKQDLKILINEIENQNTLNDLDPDILKIKTSLNLPLYINGFNITDNIHLLNLIDKKIVENIFAIAYDKYNKRLIFVTENLIDLYSYSILVDEIKLIGVSTHNIKLTPFNYISIIKELLNITILIPLRLKTGKMLGKIEFKDNLYNDIKRTKIQQEIIRNKIVKK